MASISTGLACVTGMGCLETVEEQAVGGSGMRARSKRVALDIHSGQKNWDAGGLSLPGQDAESRADWRPSLKCLRSLRPLQKS